MEKIELGNRPPSPVGARSLDDFVSRLKDLRRWAGVPVREIHRRVCRVRRKRGAESPSLSTVQDCFKLGRCRLDPELVIDIVVAFVDDAVVADTWRQAHRAVIERASMSTVVDVLTALPKPNEAFTGRADVLDSSLGHMCDRDSNDGRVALAFSGMPGIGKTELVMRLGAMYLRACNDDHLLLYVDLRGFDPDLPPASPAAVLEGFLRRLGLSGDHIYTLGLDGRVAKYHELVRSHCRPMLVILDNAASEEQIRPLLPRGPNCRILVTSRHAFLGIPDLRHIPLDVFTPDEALQLMRRKVGSRRIDEELDNAVTVAGMVGFLPLAVAVVAALISDRGDWTLADHVDRLRELRAALQLEKPVELALASSYNALDVEIRPTFRFLSLHPGRTFEVRAASALTGLARSVTQRHIDVLLDASLLRLNGSRYEFHDSVRTYAAAQAREHDTARTRHEVLVRLLEHYGRLALYAVKTSYPADAERRPKSLGSGPLPLSFDGEVHASAWLNVELANLLAVADYAATNARLSKYVVYYSAVLHRHLYVSGFYREAQSLHEQSLRMPHNSDWPFKEIDTFVRLGRIYQVTGRLRDAYEILGQAVEVAEENGDAEGEMHALIGHGHACLRLGKFMDSGVSFRRALRIACALNNRSGKLEALIGCGYFRCLTGGDLLGMRNLLRAADMAAELGHRSGRIDALVACGDACRRLLRYAEANELYGLAFELVKQSGHRNGEAAVLRGLGNAALGLCDYEKARSCFERSLGLAREIGSKAAELMSLVGCGHVSRLKGKLEMALDSYREALALGCAWGDQNGRFEAAFGLGMTFHAKSEFHRTLFYYCEALSISVDLCQVHDQARVLVGIAEVCEIACKIQYAWKYYNAAYERFLSVGAPESGSILARRNALGYESRRADMNF